MNARSIFTQYLFACGSALAILLLYLLSLPDTLFKDPLSTVLEDRHGELLGARIADDGQWRFPPVDSVPGKYKQCLLQFEDRYFYCHPGVNPFSLARALVQNIKAGKITRGGSTITMQVIRLSRKGKSRNLFEKALEIILATRLELTRSKEEILALYASHAPCGGNVVGIDAASWRYFGRSPDQLTWAESATLAVLPNSPSLIHPGRNRLQLMNKRNRLLERLQGEGVLDSMDFSLAILEPLPGAPLPLPSLAPHLLDHVYINDRGKRVISTIDATLQQKVVDIVGVHHKSLVHNGIHNAACLVLETMSGHVLAYVGNSGTGDGPEHAGDVDIIRSPRSTGSILKPILYCLMLEEGELLTGSLVPDIPTHYTGYSPKNFSPGYDGAVPAKRALSRSLNVPAVRMLQSYGMERFYHHLRKTGMQTLSFPADHYGLSLILGGAEAELWWITGIYASMGRVLGHYGPDGTCSRQDIHPPVFVVRPPQETVPVAPGGPHTFSAASVWLTFQSLLEVNRPESQAGWKSFESSKKIAWKTGTSFGFRDGWAVGTCPTHTIGVWIGNADGEGRPGLTGITTAAPVLFDVFNNLPRSPWFEVPLDELYPVRVCRQSGYLPGPYCDQTDTVYSTRRGLLSAPCPYHTIIHITPDGRYRVNSNCMETRHMKHVSWFVLPPLQELYYRSRNPGYRVLPELHPGCEEDNALAFMEMIYPRHSARVYVPMGFDGAAGKIVLEAAHRNPSTRIHWHLDDGYLGNTRYIHQMEVRPDAGKHVLTLVDASGNTLVHRFEVFDRAVIP
jgi:penicillin-binding protein 1C